MKALMIVVMLLLSLVGNTAAQAAVPTLPGSTIDCSSALDTEFVPSWGEVFVNQDTYVYGKYIYQWMYWDKPSRLAWFTANGDSTYEPDALFDGSGSGYPEPAHTQDVLPLSPGNSSTAYGYYPRNVFYNSGDIAIGYWASDLPSPYQDTAWGDNGNEWAVTIGTAMAATLSSQRVYYTVTRMLDGGAISGG